jgi:Sec-independent protein translocase protein TatA
MPDTKIGLDGRPQVLGERVFVAVTDTAGRGCHASVGQTMGDLGAHTTGRLCIDMGGRSQLGRPSFWADCTRWGLEDKLPELMREVAVRIEELRLRRAAQARARAEHAYQHAVEQEKQHAHARAAEAHREKILQEQLDHWRMAQELHSCAAKLAARIRAATADSHTDTRAIQDARLWLSWVVDRADRFDPTMQLATWPQPAELTSYELGKFMNRVPEPAELRYRPESY